MAFILQFAVPVGTPASDRRSISRPIWPAADGLWMLKPIFSGGKASDPSQSVDSISASETECPEPTRKIPALFEYMRCSRDTCAWSPWIRVVAGTCNQRERSINRRHVYAKQTATRERSINRRHVYMQSRQHLHTYSVHAICSGWVVCRVEELHSCDGAVTTLEQLEGATMKAQVSNLN